MIFRYKSTIAKALKKQPKQLIPLIKSGEIKKFTISDFKSKKTPTMEVWVHMPSLATEAVKFLESCKNISNQ